ncbi:MAG: hypothetical protein LUG16_01315 [Candidatus Gastranaerophilales bacterium]|nr:hypothetical protein [Candidatus Gastranaerophilales bacterium]
MSSLSGLGSNLYAQQKQNIVNQRYNEIYAHEQAHKSAAGSLGGAIVIEKDSDGIPVGGHVDIKMPVLNKENPDETIEHADTVIKSAMAPDDPSTQDYKVASEARDIRSQAQNFKNNNQTNPLVGQNLNCIA